MSLDGTPKGLKNSWNSLAEFPNRIRLPMTPSFPSPPGPSPRDPILARALESGIPELKNFGLVSRLAHSRQSLFQILGDLEPEGIEGLARRYGSHFLEKIKQLSQEQDPRFFWKNLLSLGKELQKSGDPGAALGIFDFLSREKNPYSSRALQEKNALMGVGSLGPRLAPLSAQFSNHVFEWGVLGGMAAGSYLYKTLRYTGLKKLLNYPVHNIFTRGWGARGLSSGLAFTGEVGGFVLAQKTIRQITQGEQDWSLDTFWDEALTLGTHLFFLKSFGSLSESLFYRAHGLNPIVGRATPLAGISGVSQVLLPQAAMLGGIYVGQYAEAFLWNRPLSQGSSPFFDSLIFWVQFQMAGKFSSELMGSQFHRHLKKLDLRTHALSEGETPTWGPGAISIFPNRQVVGLGGPQVGLAEGLALGKAPIKMIASKEGGGGGGKDFLSQRLRALLASRIEASPERLDSIIENFRRTLQVDAEAYYLLLRDVQIASQFTPDRPVYSSGELLERATSAFRHVQEMDPASRGNGFYLHSLLQITLGEVIRSGNPRYFSHLVRITGREQTVSSLEKFLQRYGLDRAYRLQEGAWEQALKGEVGLDWHRRLKSLRIPGLVRNLIGQYLASYEFSSEAREFRENSSLLRRNRYGDFISEPFRAEHILGSLEYLFNDASSEKPVAKIFFRKILQCVQSPVPLLRLDRLFKLLALDVSVEKIENIGLEEPVDQVSFRKIIHQPRSNPEELARQINGTALTGYVRDLPLARKMIEFYRALNTIFYSQEHFQREDSSLSFRRRLMDEVGLRMGPHEFLELMRYRDTPLSREAYEAIVEHQIIDLVEKSESEMTQGKPYPYLGLFNPPHRSPTGRPQIWVLGIRPGTPAEEQIRLSLHRAEAIVHEYEHFKHSEDLNFSQSAHDRLISEMRAHTESNLFALINGDSTVWSKVGLVDPAKFGLYLRSFVESRYLQPPRQFPGVRRRP